MLHWSYMRESYVIYLAKRVLAAVGTPVPKVRLAKLVYFSFKELILANLAKPEELAFIRMPLGPVPSDLFPQIENDAEVVVTQTDIGLTYNRQSFALNSDIQFTNDSVLDLLREKVSLFNKYPTSTLVEKSHQDLSWINNINGTRYTVDKQDLVPFVATSTANRITDAFDDQLVQSKLIAGMEDEIIKDSSALEFPEQYNE